MPSRRPAAGEAGLDPTTARRLETARQLMARYACSEAALDLTKLLAQRPKLARAHYLLGAASICRGKHREGIDSYHQAVVLDERYRRDPRMLEDIGGLLTARSKRSRMRALVLLERLGKPALDKLLTATTSTDRALRAKALAAVIRLGAAGRVDWLTALHLDLKQLSCSQIKQQRTVERLARTGDPRVGPILKRALYTRTGIFRHRYRYGCVRQRIKAELDRMGLRPN